MNLAILGERKEKKLNTISGVHLLQGFQPLKNIGSEMAEDAAHWTTPLHLNRPTALENMCTQHIRDWMFDVSAKEKPWEYWFEKKHDAGD